MVWLSNKTILEIWLYMVLLFPVSLHGAPQADGDDVDCWWCEPEGDTASTTETLEPHVIEEDATMCECVPWYLCGDEKITTDGAGMLDLRTSAEKNVLECTDPLHTCCGIPLDVDEENPDERKNIQDLPSNTPCECMPFKDCPERLIVNNGQGKTCLNVAKSSSSHSKCFRATDVCCANADEVDEALASALTSDMIDASSLDNCECVDPYMCDKQGYIKDNYEDNLNEIESNQRGKITTMNVNECSNSGKVCCRQRVECECVNQNQCDEDGFIITDGSFLMDVRIFGSQAQSQSQLQGVCNDPCQVCCKLREEEEPSNVTATFIPITSTTTQIQSEECYCVDESQCSSYYDYNYGDGMLDARINMGASINKCQNPGHICCDTPPTTTPAPTITTSSTASHIPACSKRNKKGTLNVRIMGFRDDQSQFGEFPWVATILQEKGADEPLHFVGGGTLIHSHVVMTAAHKIQNLPKNKLHIRLGEWDTQTVTELLPHQDIKVERVVFHPRFNRKNLRHDVALIFLKEEAATNDHIKKICLASDTSQVDPSDCVINGWGTNGFDLDGQYQKIMKSITLPLVNLTTCQTQLRRTSLGHRYKLHSSFICAGGEAGQDGCKGDGGGPLACAMRGGDKDTYLLVGITAWGIGCGDEGVPGVYVDVPNHFDWINQEIESVYPSTTAAPPTVTQQIAGLQKKKKENKEKRKQGGRSSRIKRT